MKIRARVTLWYAAILTASLLIMGAGTYQEISEQLHRDHSAQIWQHALDEASEMVFYVGLPAVALGLLVYWHAYAKTHFVGPKIARSEAIVTKM